VRPTAAERSRTPAGERVASLAVRIAFVAGTIALWHLASTRWGVSLILLPRPAAVARELVDIVGTGAFVEDLRVTLYELLLAFGIAGIAGTTVGYAVSRSRYLVDVFGPLLSGLYAIPAILFFPLYVMVFGLGPDSKIAMGATISFFPVALNTIAGFGRVDRIWILAARSMGCSNYQLFRRVLLPAAFPVVLTGLRMGFILALLAILGSETIASMAGLGHQIASLAESMDTARMFAYMAFAIAIAGVLNAVIALTEAVGRHR
jgi:ABC-type nitrate/sulfonate/bicarbonate transport system permease component